MQLFLLDESGPLYPTYKAFEEGYLQELRKVPSGGPLPRYPFFVLAVVGIPESHLPIVDDWFLRMKQSFLRAGPLDTGPQYEIKGSLLYALRQGKKPFQWESGKGRRRRYTTAQKDIWEKLGHSQLEELEGSIFDLFLRIQPAIWAVVVDQGRIYARHKDRTWPPHYWALTYLQQRAAYFIQAQHGSYERGLFIMDETSTLSTAAQFDKFLRTRQEINETASWPVDFRRHLVDVPVTGKSHLIQALQLVDVVAHTIWRMVHKDDPFGWFANIERFLAKHWRTGSYKNAGLTYITADALKGGSMYVKDYE